jgi:glycine cleavage system H lipoate-binding protein
VSAYVNDPRVKVRDGLFGTAYIVECGDDLTTRPAVVEREPRGEGWWACWQYGPEGRLVESADTADEAIRSLIGDPR